MRMKEEIKKKFLKLLCNTLHQKNGIEVIVDNENLKNAWEITIKYHSDHRKHRYELVNETKKQCSIIFIDKDITIKVIMECRTTLAHKFRTRLGLNNMMSS